MRSSKRYKVHNGSWGFYTDSAILAEAYRVLGFVVVDGHWADERTAS